jgi:hypothetical protein
MATENVYIALIISLEFNNLSSYELIISLFTAIFKKSIVFSNKNIAFLYFYINYFI